MYFSKLVGVWWLLVGGGFSSMFWSKVGAVGVFDSVACAYVLMGGSSGKISEGFLLGGGAGSFCTGIWVIGSLLGSDFGYWGHLVCPVKWESVIHVAQNLMLSVGLWEQDCGFFPHLKHTFAAVQLPEV